MTTQPDDKLGQLSALGVAVWLDDISRERLRTDNLAALMRDFHVVGVTSNPTIFASALGKGDAYDEQLADIRIRHIGAEQASWEITSYDIRWAADVLRPAYDGSDGLDGRVSIEVDPRIARKTDETVASAKFLWWAVDRENLYIKIPATAEGLPAITQTIAQGISVNVTLIFSLERYGEVIDAYMAGLEAADAAGYDLSKIASVASFFVSRVDSEADGRLEKIGSPEALALRGQAAIANARLAYELFEQRSATPRWEALKARGARPQRPLWASTSTKNPEYKDTMYVTDLVAPGVVNTMPEPTLHAVADHGDVRGDTIHGTYDASRQYFEQLEAVGVSYDDVVQVLEDEGVEKFAASWNQLLDTIKSQLAEKGSR
jgi:transaldolase